MEDLTMSNLPSLYITLIIMAHLLILIFRKIYHKFSQLKYTERYILVHNKLVDRRPVD